MMGHLGYLRGQAKKALRDARVEEMVYTMFNLEAHYGERKADVLRRSRAVFPTLADADEEEADYGKAYDRLHAYCRFHELY